MTQKPSMADEIISNGTFPNDTFTVPVKNIIDDFIQPDPLQVNITHLNQLGISVDASSMVAETGRISFFYIRLPPQGATKFQNIAIRFDNASILNVFPLSFAASGSVSGIRRLGSLSDSTTVYQIEITMAKSMCSGVPDGTCRVVYWKPYLILENNISVPGNFSISLPIACGSQCGAPVDSSCASASLSCASCNGQQVSGADTPVTRRYNMGRSSGSFNFTYMTYTVKDRIKVTYEDQILLDSGCVGTDDFNGTQRRLLSFSGKSQEIRVDVEPNCNGTAGTAWDFIVECINPCSDSSVKVILTAGPTEIKDGGVTYISNEAEMPGLTSYYCYPSTIEWTFNLDYEPLLGVSLNP
uniref:Uncharacterized protein n=1 Tax=Panagrolaimus davidi TaxID=227884 RepID=A0A914PU60_9BILA